MTASAPATRDIGRVHNTGRRIVQFLLDVMLAGLILSVLGTLADIAAPGAGFEQLSAGWTSVSALTAAPGAPSIAAVTLTVLVWLAVFVAFPIWKDRTPAMTLLDLRIVRLDGGRPAAGQHAGRGLLLVVDSAFGGFVGWLVMVCSGRRQRVGDHAAGTLVVRDTPPA